MPHFALLSVQFAIAIYAFLRNYCALQERVSNAERESPVSADSEMLGVYSAECG